MAARGGGNLATRAIDDDSTGLATSSTGSGSGSMLFIIVGVGVVLLNALIFLILRYCYKRRQQRNAQASGGAAGGEFGHNGVGAGGATRGDGKSRRLLSLAELEAMFPLTTYKEACRIKETRLTEKVFDNGPDVEAQVIPATATRLGDIEANNGSMVIVEEKRPTVMTLGPEELVYDDQGHIHPVTDKQTNDYSPKQPKEEVQILEGKPMPPEKHIKYARKIIAEQPQSVTISALDSEQHELRITTSNTSGSGGGDAAGAAAGVCAEPATEIIKTDEICAICIEPLEDADSVRLLTCGHMFHSGCVDPWLTTRRAYCPLCKFDFSHSSDHCERTGEGGAPDDMQMLLQAIAAASPQDPPPAEIQEPEPAARRHWWSRG